LAPSPPRSVLSPPGLTVTPSTPLPCDLIFTYPPDPFARSQSRTLICFGDVGRHSECHSSISIFF
jgi:hypothetical protein